MVLQFCTADLPLTPAQRLKLIKLSGPRYDPQSDTVKMSCEMFDAAAQNKRYLGDLVDALLAEARGRRNNDDEGATDTFDDVPVDFRHVRWKTRLAFPDAWKMTPARRARLDDAWRASEQAEAKRIAEGRLVDGVAVIADSLRLAAPTMATMQPVRIAAGPAQQGRGPRLPRGLRTGFRALYS